MRRILLLLLASLFLMAMKCGPAPCPVGKEVSVGDMIAWYSIYDDGFDEIDSMHILISRNGGIVQSSGYRIPLDSVSPLWRIESHDDSITLPAKVTILFYGRTMQKDSLQLALRENQELSLLCNCGSGVNGRTLNNVRETGCSKYVCWIDRYSENEGTCAP